MLPILQSVKQTAPSYTHWMVSMPPFSHRLLPILQSVKQTAPYDTSLLQTGLHALLSYRMLPIALSHSHIDPNTPSVIQAALHDPFPLAGCFSCPPPHRLLPKVLPHTDCSPCSLSHILLFMPHLLSMLPSLTLISSLFKAGSWKLKASYFFPALIIELRTGIE